MLVMGRRVRSIVYDLNLYLPQRGMRTPQLLLKIRAQPVQVRSIHIAIRSQVNRRIPAVITPINIELVYR